ncbi:MAG: type 4a pilus biogenesis protein PilO [Phycisphaerales bacterium]
MNPKARQTILTAVLLGVPVASFFLVFRPQSREIQLATREIQLRKEKLGQLQAVTAQAPDLARATEEIKQSIAQIEARMPSSKELDNVLRDVATIATKCGLRVPKFNRMENVLTAGSAQEQQLDVEIAGEFGGFYSFLLELEKLPRITRLTDMKLERVADVEKAKDGLLRAHFKLSIYYSQGESSVAAVGGK